jgi:hypothetical protein
MRWGGLRNLLSGVTWVAHHDRPHRVLGESAFPVRVVRNYVQLTSVRHGRPRELLQGAKRRDVFFIHVAEGTDADAASELARLDAMGGLEKRTVLVHGTALNASDRRRVNDAGAAVVLCPCSNQFLLGAWPSLENLDRWALGTDSTLTGSAHLLDELRVARDHLACSPSDLVGAVTHRAATILRLPLGAGRIAVGAPACLVALRTEAPDPTTAMLEARPRDLSAVMVEGSLRVAHPDLAVSAAASSLQGTVFVEGERRLLRLHDAELVRRIEGRLGTRPSPGWFSSTPVVAAG